MILQLVDRIGGLKPWLNGRGLPLKNEISRQGNSTYTCVRITVYHSAQFMKFLLLGFLVIILISSPSFAQWLDFRTSGIPRTPDGKPNLTAPTPRMADGKPDLTGIWVADTSKYLGNLAADSGPVPFQPWAEKVYEERRANLGKDDPEARCMPQGVPKVNTLPYPFKIFQLPGETVILYEMFYLYRQIFTDGRQLPTEFVNPSWMGYSVGKWDGDDFVVETAGMNEQFWMDTNGHPHTDQLRVTERFKRKDFGHMEVEVTIDDPKAYTKPWMATIKQHLLPDTELLEFVCEKNLDPAHLVGK